MKNPDIASVLERVADALEAQEASVFRVRAWRHAAETVRGEPRPLAQIFSHEGTGGLFAVHGIGKTIDSAIRELLSTGRLGILERLSGEDAPDELLASGPSHHPELHAAGEEPHPKVDAILEVDREYLRRATAGTLKKIVPRHFNPHKEACLPVLHADRAGWSFTARFSNTARAHELGTTRDWVVVTYERDGSEGQCTVVTEGRGPLAGRRVVRGRESEGSRGPTSVETAEAR